MVNITCNRPVREIIPGTANPRMSRQRHLREGDSTPAIQSDPHSAVSNLIGSRFCWLKENEARDTECDSRADIRCSGLCPVRYWLRIQSANGRKIPAQRDRKSTPL